LIIYGSKFLKLKDIKFKFPSIRFLYAISICYVAFFYPIIALYNQFTNQGTNIVSLFYRSSTFIISFVIIFREGILKKNRPIPAAIGLLIIFWIYYLIKLIYDLFILGLVQNPLLSPSYYLLQTIGIGFINMLSFYFIGKKIDYFLLSRFLFILLVIINVLILTSFLNSYGLDITAYASMRLGIKSEETNIEYMNPITIGSYSSFLLILIFYKKGFKLIYLFFIVIALFNLLVSASKGPLVSLIAVILLHFIAKMYRVNVKFIVHLIVAIFVFLLIYNSGIINDFYIFERIFNIDQNASSIYRISFLKSALNQIQENVLFGTHYYVLSDNSSPHNIFIDIILSTGLFGLGLIFYPMFMFLKLIFNNILQNPIIAISFYYFCIAQFSGYVYGILDLWTLMGLFLAYKFNHNSSQIDN
jgi:hypothetical protein